MRLPRRPKLGLALGGGGARGLAHIGVLKVLLGEGIRPAVVVGTSMGALVGGAYAARDNIEEVERSFRALLHTEAFQKSRLNYLGGVDRDGDGTPGSISEWIRFGKVVSSLVFSSSFVPSEEMAAHLAGLLPDLPIEDTPIRFGAVTLDLKSAEERVVCRGPLREAAAASAAIPGYLPPVRTGDGVYVDGGWVDGVPVLPAFYLGAEVVVAVNATPMIEKDVEFDKGTGISRRAGEIRGAAQVRLVCALAEVAIEPDLAGIQWADFDRIDRCIEAGEEAAREALPKIRRMLRREAWLSALRPTRGKRLAESTLAPGGLRIRVG